MAYDEMGNYTGYDEVDASPVNPYDYEEEERKKEELRKQLEEAQAKQEQLASQVAHKQEITTMADGSKVEKTTRHMPAGGPVNPADYNASISQQESGNNPNIGYHDRNKGSAYGQYGLTSAGYEDARKLNPNLPADITAATPEQQTAAQDAYTQQNSKYLQNYGIEPNKNTLAAAHFLGAKGLSDYLKTGYISEAAAKANGGAENVKRIVDQRLGGQSAASSGGATAPNVPQARPGEGVAVATGNGVQGTMSIAPGEEGGQPTQKPKLEPISPEAAQPAPGGPAPNSYDEFGTPGYSEARAGLDKHVDAYTTAQNDPNALMALSANKDVPDWMQDKARNRAADIITQQRDMKAAQQKLAEATPTDLAKYMREKTSGGSWLKAIFYASIGAKALAQEEGAKLGIGTEKIVTGADGKAHIVKVSSNGTPLEGYSAETGKKMTPEEMVAALGGAGTGKVSTSAEQFQDKDGNIYRSQSNDKGQLVMKNAVTGEVYKGDPTKLTRMRDVSAQAAAEKKQEFRRENDTTAFANSIRKLDYGNKLKAVEEAQQAAINRGEPAFTDAELSAMGVNRPDLGAVKAAAAPQPAQPGVATAGGTVAAPVKPTGEVAPAPVNPAAPVAPIKRETVEEGKKRQEEEKSQRESQQAAAKKIATEAGEAVAASPQTIVNLKKIDKAISHLEKGNTNYGAPGGGLRKGELTGETAQKVGRFFNTEESGPTDDVTEAVNGVVLERANLGKMTDADLKFYTAGKPTLDTSPERVKEWLETAKEDIKNKLEFNKQQAASGGRKGPMEQTPSPVPPPPSIPGGTSKIIGGVTYVYDGKGWKKK